ncbi:MAG TPA: hypothetical protein ENI95_06880 [Chloroflexi bacterium]|nr:hypothetical protein [Chloroflexota bacterium]
MVRRITEQTFHTGRISYMQARGLTGLDYPVLMRPLEKRYDYVVARQPFEDRAGLFYRVWEPTRLMHLVATDTFNNWYTGHPQRIEDDAAIWEALKRIHRIASAAHPEAREQAPDVIGRVSDYLSEKRGEPVPVVSLECVAEIYRAWGSLVFPHFITAAVVPATLLLMLGVPRERVAIFGMYYQDPTVYYYPNSDWQAGFMVGTPFYALLGVYVGGYWMLIDFTLLADEPGGRFPRRPRPHLRSPEMGYHPDDGSRMVIDYEHPYTMIFAPRGPYSRRSPLLTRIPLIELRRAYGL